MSTSRDYVSASKKKNADLLTSAANIGHRNKSNDSILSFLCNRITANLYIVCTKTYKKKRCTFLKSLFTLYLTTISASSYVGSP